MNLIPTLQEFSISLNFKDMILPLRLDCLKEERVIPKDWTISYLSLDTEPIKQIRFSNGISIVGRPNLLTFIEPIKINSSGMMKLPQIVNRYISVTSKAPYVSVIFNINIFVGFDPDNQKGSHEYITNFISHSQHHDIIGELEKVNIQLVYKIGLRQLILNISEVRLELPNKQTIPSILFSGKSSYKIKGSTTAEKLIHLTQVIDISDKEFEACRELVIKNFLDPRAKA